MTRRPPSPFTGIRLSAPAQHRVLGPDQRLFSPEPSPRPITVSDDGTSTQQASQEASQEAGKVGTPSPIAPRADATDASARPPFALDAPATEKNSYMFSQEELWALKDVEAEIERAYRTEVPKYNIVRLGLHMLLEDYFAHKQDSFLIRRLRLARS